MTPSARDREMALKIALTDKQIGSIAAAFAQARAEEREACAKVADDKQRRHLELEERGKDDNLDASMHAAAAIACGDVAAAIRARSCGGQVSDAQNEPTDSRVPTNKRDTYTLKEIWLALNEWRWPWCKLPVATEAEREAIRVAWRSMPKRAEP